MAATEGNVTVAKETSSNHQQDKTKQQLADELAHLSSHFKGQCKVIDAAGKFVKTVKLHPDNLDIVFNFKVTGIIYKNT